MEFNPSKCVVIHITRSRTPVPSQYLLHGQVLESVAGSKYLCVEISSNLSFNGHIQNITTSASRSLGFRKRNIRSKNPELRELAYKTLVRPLVEYSSSVWSPYTIVFPLGPFSMALRHALFLERHALFLCDMPFF